MDDCKCFVQLTYFEYPAYLNGNNELQWRLADYICLGKRGFKNGRLEP